MIWGNVCGWSKLKISVLIQQPIVEKMTIVSLDIYFWSVCLVNLYLPKTNENLHTQPFICLSKGIKVKLICAYPAITFFTFQAPKLFINFYLSKNSVFIQKINHFGLHEPEKNIRSYNSFKFNQGKGRSRYILFEHNR